MASPKTKKNTSTECTARPESESPWKVLAANVTKGVQALHKRWAESLWTRSNSVKNKLGACRFEEKETVQQNSCLGPRKLMIWITSNTMSQVWKEYFMAVPTYWRCKWGWAIVWPDVTPPKISGWEDGGANRFCFYDSDLVLTSLQEIGHLKCWRPYWECSWVGFWGSTHLLRLGRYLCAGWRI